MAHLGGIDMLFVEPCPWCGEDAKFYAGGNYVECTEYLCGARGPIVKFVERMRDGESAEREREREAVESWNIVAELASKHLS